MLSDMDPILTDVSWTENSSYQASDDFGGTGGTAFNDIGSIPASAEVSTLSALAPESTTLDSPCRTGPRSRTAARAAPPPR